ncbi:PepSY domain-containing protein [Nocardioides sp. GXZ039]|uniref:PepSY domain-containing protein n=1 Tax=Nocardioides sp. GXZ039 TaxID=3136018 RepID=UPI0030F37DC9
MNIKNLKNIRPSKKKLAIAGVAAVAVLGTGGVAIAAQDGVGNDSDDVSNGALRDDLVAAARTAIDDQDAKATDVEKSDDGDAAYEVELTAADGTEYDVSLDKDANVVSTEQDDDGDDDQRETDSDDTTRTVEGIRIDDSERAIPDTDVAAIATAAQAAVPGTVTEIEAEVADADDTAAEKAVAYQVEITGEDGKQYDVTLDTDLKVLDHQLD